MKGSLKAFALVNEDWKRPTSLNGTIVLWKKKKMISNQPNVLIYFNKYFKELTRFNYWFYFQISTKTTASYIYRGSFMCQCL